MKVSLFTTFKKETQGIKNLYHGTPSMLKKSCAENVDKFIKSSEKIENIGKKKPYVKPESKVFSVESDSQLLAASDGDNGLHRGWENPHNPHSRGMEYDGGDDAYGWDD